MKSFSSPSPSFNPSSESLISRRHTGHAKGINSNSKDEDEDEEDEEEDEEDGEDEEKISKQEEQKE